ncbi:MAG: hypothetical protein M1818_002754 [Claussenomyces sp. TS43310]|nr:MAG: hypothetical protein M1818_002754 [Claussenomyces sp. TS43310]
MAPNQNLVLLAAAVRKALSSSLVAASKDEVAKKARLDLLDMLPDLERTLLGPRETLLRLTWTPLTSLSLQYLTHFNIARHVPLDAPTSYKDLAARAGVDESQLRRLVRHAMLNRIFHEPEKDIVAHSPASRLLATDPQLHGWVALMTDSFWPATAHAVEALERWPGSTSPQETSVSIWKRRDTTWFKEIAAQPGGLARFRDGMAVIGTGEGWEAHYLADNFPWASFPEGTVVDIGGADGHQSIAIAEAHPHLKMIVQDLIMEDAVVAAHQAKLSEAVRPRIQFMAHDMFTEQPVKGADVYFFRCTLHNWADENVVKVLRALVPALKPGARVVVQDNGLAAPGTERLMDEVNQRNLDVMSMALTNSKERQQGEWKALFEEADARYKWKGASKPDGSKLWIMETEWQP